jgi:RNA polymerase primary sigma factor
MTTPIALETKSLDPEAELRFRRGQRRAIGVVRASLRQLLSAGEECALAERIKAGDTAAQHQLILANLNLVLAIVRDYKNCGLAVDDLIQEGNLGLIRASQDFDPVAYGNRFQTYASFWIRTSIHRALVVNGSLTRSTEYVGLLRLRYSRAIRELEGRSEGVEAEGGDDLAEASLDEIAERMGVSLRKLKTAQLPRFDRSDSVQVGAGGKRVAVEELAAVRQPPETDLIDQENDELVHAALFRLSPFEAWVIRERYGFRQLRPELYGWAASRKEEGLRKDEGGRMKDEPEKPSSDSSFILHPSSFPDGSGQAYYHRTYGEIGLDCGLSVHRVRLVEKAALDKLRKLLAQRPAVGSC